MCPYKSKIINLVTDRKRKKKKPTCFVGIIYTRYILIYVYMHLAILNTLRDNLQFSDVYIRFLLYNLRTLNECDLFPYEVCFIVCLCWFYEGELQNTIAELEESHCKLATLKAQRDAAKGAGFPILNLGSKHVSGDKIRDKVKDLQDMESALKELMVLYWLLSCLSALITYLFKKPET